MKKVLLIIVCLLCVVLSAIAAPIHVSASMNYSSIYKGNGRANYGYSASPIHSHMSSAGLAQTPTMTMTSTSSSFNRGISCGNELMTSASQVRGIYTSASNVTGGVMAGEIVGPSHSPRRINGVPDDPTWDCHCEDKDGDGFCDHCGAPVDEFDGHCENEPCWCPLDFNWAISLFMAFLACAYALYKVRARKSSEK